MVRVFFSGILCFVCVIRRRKSRRHMGGVGDPVAFWPQKPLRNPPCHHHQSHSSSSSSTSSSSSSSPLEAEHIAHPGPWHFPGARRRVLRGQRAQRAKKEEERKKRKEEERGKGCGGRIFSPQHHRASPTPLPGARGAAGGGEALQEAAAPSLHRRTRAEQDWIFSVGRFTPYCRVLFLIKAVLQLSAWHTAAFNRTRPNRNPCAPVHHEHGT